jgi:hypothetical protein
VKRDGLLLGIFSSSAQVLLLRELVSSLHGDELFIGTALFGWLAAVAAGAYAGGRKSVSGVRLQIVFIVAAATLPASIIAARLSPLAITSVAGEAVSFTAAAGISALLMCIPGALSGWLFGAVSRAQKPASQSIVTVYLWEGIGAFAAGIAIAIAVGTVFSTFVFAIIFGAIVVAGRQFKSRIPAATIRSACLLASVAAIILGEQIDIFFDSMKYPRYEIAGSFDTKYSHQAILRRDSSFTLLTDNTVEATRPDIERAENELLVPLLYAPHARRVLYAGRMEFGIADIGAKLKNIDIAGLDSRKEVGRALEKAGMRIEEAKRITTDIGAYIATQRGKAQYDIIIVRPGQLSSYFSNRFITKSFLHAVKKICAPGAVVHIVMPYDSDRFVSAQTKRALSAAYNTVQACFEHVAAWPGTSTLFMASDSPVFDISYDSLCARIAQLEYSPQFVNDNYLFERLGAFKRERLFSALKQFGIDNTIEKPVLAHLHILHNSRMSKVDHALIAAFLDKPVWAGIAVLPVAFFLILLITARGKTHRFSFFVFFTAGCVSLSLELIVFYLYQSIAGALYSHLAFMIGSYMLGLALGTYFAMKRGDRWLAYAAFGALAVLVAVLYPGYRIVSPRLALLFSLPYLFLIAASASVLFVETTRSYYGTRETANRGSGYAWELAGSCIAALCVTTILLPAVGLKALLIMQIACIAGGLIALIFTAK